jgi:hypothetical protein
MSEPLRPVDAARILARASAIDNRDPSVAADEVWCNALNQAGLTFAHFQDCLTAVDIHYARSTDRLMPAHLIGIVREQARDRALRDRARLVLDAPPVTPNPQAHRRLMAVITEAVADRDRRERARYALLDDGCTCPAARVVTGARVDPAADPACPVTYPHPWDTPTGGTR